MNRINSVTDTLNSTELDVLCLIIDNSDHMLPL